MHTHRHIAEASLTVLGLIVLVAWTTGELRYAQGKRETLASFECPRGEPGRAFMRTDLRTGEVICLEARYAPAHPPVEQRRITAAQRRMGAVR